MEWRLRTAEISASISQADRGIALESSTSDFLLEAAWTFSSQTDAERNPSRSEMQ